MKKVFIFLTLALFSIGCEKSELKADVEFYNQSLESLITGYEIWAKEAEGFAYKNGWAQKISEPMIGEFDISYYKKNKANINIKLRLKYLIDIEKALDEMSIDSRNYNYELKNGVFQAGFYYTPLNGERLIQTWTVSVDSLLENKKRGIQKMELNYEEYKSQKSEFRDANGSIVIVNLNNINKLTVFEPSQEIYVFSNMGNSTSTERRTKTMGGPKKIKDF
jgi:hypothetical protein